MADEIETLLVAVRADTQLFARDVAAMKAELAGPFAAGADQARADAGECAGAGARGPASSASRI